MLDNYMNPFDLTFLSVFRSEGQEWSALPGFLAQNPPKKCARGRENDRLVAYLSLSGNISYSSSDYQNMLEGLSESFYHTPGSLTFALKSAVVSLNDHLVEENMKTTGKGLYGIGSLVLANLRENSMYIVQAGPVHVYHLSGQANYIHDTNLAGKGLGLSQTAEMFFAQIVIEPGDRLLISNSLPPNWERSLTEGRGSTALDITRRRLLAITNENVRAFLMLATEGSGAISILSAGKAGNTPDGQEISASVPNPNPDDLNGAAELPEFDFPIQNDSDSPSLTEPVDLQPEDPRLNMNGADVPRAGIDGSRASTFPPNQAMEDLKAAVKPGESAGDRSKNLLRFLADTINRWQKTNQKMSDWGEKVLPRLLPAGDELSSFLNGRNWSIFFAIALPLVLILSTRIVYFRLGYEAQYNSNISLAQKAIQQAQVETDPNSARVEWKIALDKLDKADLYQTGSNLESQQLRQTAQSSLDALDKVVRLNFVQAFSSPLPKNLLVSRMAASDSDLYILDAMSGKVLRGSFNGSNYDLDANFQCGPGVYDNSISVTKMIDIITLPRTNTNETTLLGIDGAGNLLYCTPGKAARALTLPAPSSGWKTITAMTYDNQNLYVLDAGNNAVWVYGGSDQVKFEDAPYFYFGEQVPSMNAAIDLAVNGDDLYLLHQDGHITTCTYSHLDSSPTRCNDPANYIDTRPGYSSGTLLGDAIFTQMTFSSPPDPAVALLEPFTHSVYRFSPRSLELQNRLMAAPGKNNPLPQDSNILAMAFSPNKFLFLFTDGKVFFAPNAQ